MSTLFRYSTYSCVPHSAEIIESDCNPVATKDFGKYRVDDSSFVPMSEAVKRVTGGTLSKEQISAMYDFPDGKDTGRKIPVDRTHSFTGDIAQAAKLLRDAEFKAQESIDIAKAEFDLDQKIEQLNSSAVSADSNTSE